MHYVVQRLTEYSKSHRLASCVIALLLVLTSPAWAGYIPPSQPSAPRGGNTTTTGRRGGCQGDEPAPLTALAPSSHVGQTTSIRPTFAWYAPDAANVPIEFHLFNSSGSLIYKTELQSSPGIMSLALPETQPLQIGQRYRWQVTLLCNPNRPSSAVVTSAEIEVVTLPQPLATSLAAADGTARSNLLAEAGFWYDAFAEAIMQEMDQESRQTLLISLADVEASNGNGERSTQLRQIAEMTKIR